MVGLDAHDPFADAAAVTHATRAWRSKRDCGHVANDAAPLALEPFTLRNPLPEAARKATPRAPSWVAAGSQVGYQSSNLFLEHCPLAENGFSVRDHCLLVSS